MIQYEDNLRIEKEITVMLRDKQYLHRVSRRADPYIYYILQEIDKRQLPRELALLPIVESAYRPSATSRAKAAGLWQFIPSTSRYLGMQMNWWYDARRDVVDSTQYALDYLKKTNQRFDGDWLLTLAAYNAGYSKVRRAIKHNKKSGKPVDYWNLKLPDETKNYVPRFLAASRIFTRSDDYSVRLHPVKNKPHFGLVDIHSQLDLKLAAELAGLTPQQLKHYNPGFSRWTTAPDGPHRLLLPRGKLKGFNKKFAKLASESRLRWIKYKVKYGDTLTGLAVKNGIGISLLKSTNNLQHSMIRAGQALLIPDKNYTGKNPEKSAARKTIISKRSAPPANHKDYYTVQSGDTLWRIARRYHLAVSTLLALNSLDERAIIQPGQRLKIRSDNTQTKVAASV